MNAFLLNGTRTSSNDNETHCDSEQRIQTVDIGASGDTEFSQRSQCQPRIELNVNDIIENIDVDSSIVPSSYVEIVPQTVAEEPISSSSIECHDMPKIVGPDPTKPMKLKAKFLRAQRKLEKQQKNIASGSKNATEIPSPAKRPCRNIDQTLQSLINAAPTNGRHNLQVWACDLTFGNFRIECYRFSYFCFSHNFAVGKTGSIYRCRHR